MIVPIASTLESNLLSEDLFFKRMKSTIYILCNSELGRCEDKYIKLMITVLYFKPQFSYQYKKLLKVKYK